MLRSRAASHPLLIARGRPGPWTTAPTSAGEGTRRAFLQKFREKYGEESDYVAAHAYDTMKLIAAAIELGGPDRTAIRDALGQLKKDARLVVKDGTFVLWDGAAAAGA